jgi:DNA (cytosine-5)-methyltransferase 1
MALKLLDLFCGAGLASDGYVAAGFVVGGVDIRPQPNYPYTQIIGDALEVLEDLELLRRFDAIHASPPCQAHTRAKHLRNAQGGKSKAGDLLTPTLKLLRKNAKKLGIPWVVENVPGAPGMEEAVIECGSSYDLKVRRHRLFLSDDVPLVRIPCRHKEQGKPIGVYHVMGDTCKGVCSKTGKLVIGGSTAKNLEEGLWAMGMARKVTWNELKEGLPPAYTKHIGEQLRLYISMKSKHGMP